MQRLRAPHGGGRSRCVGAKWHCAMLAHACTIAGTSRETLFKGQRHNGLQKRPRVKGHGMALVNTRWRNPPVLIARHNQPAPQRRCHVGMLGLQLTTRAACAGTCWTAQQGHLLVSMHGHEGCTQAVGGRSRASSAGSAERPVHG